MLGVWFYISCKFRPTVILFLKEVRYQVGKDQACAKIAFKIDDDDSRRNGSKEKNLQKEKIAALDGWMDECQVCNIPPGKVDTRHYTVLNPVCTCIRCCCWRRPPHREILQKKRLIQTFINFFSFLFFAAAVSFCIFYFSARVMFISTWYRLGS